MASNDTVIPTSVVLGAIEIAPQYARQIVFSVAVIQWLVPIFWPLIKESFHQPGQVIHQTQDLWRDIRCLVVFVICQGVSFFGFHLMRTIVTLFQDRKEIHRFLLVIYFCAAACCGIVVLTGVVMPWEATVSSPAQMDRYRLISFSLMMVFGLLLQFFYFRGATWTYSAPEYLDILGTLVFLMGVCVAGGMSHSSLVSVGLRCLVKIILSILRLRSFVEQNPPLPLIKTYYGVLALVEVAECVGYGIAIGLVLSEQKGFVMYLQNFLLLGLIIVNAFQIKDAFYACNAAHNDYTVVRRPMLLLYTLF